MKIAQLLRPTGLDNIRSERIFDALLAALGFSIGIFSTAAFGPGVSPDSISYIAAARSLSHGNGYLNFDGSPFTLWPPLFPTILAVAVAAGIDVLQFARFFNAAIFGMAIFSFGRIASSVIAGRALRRITVATAALSFPFVKMFVMTWSEPLFILLVLIFLHRLARMRATQTLSRRSVTMAATVTACACLQRYLGVALVICGAVSLLCSSWAKWKDRLLSVGIFCVLSLLPVAIWVLRNYVLVRSATGPRVTSSTSVLTSALDLVVVSTHWLLPFNTHMAARLAVFFLLTVGVSMVLFAKKIRNDHGILRDETAFIFIAAILIVAYCAALIAITGTIALERISQRYLSPIFPMVLLLVFKAVEEFSRWCVGRGASYRLAGIFALVLCLAMLGQSALTTSQVISIWREEGAGDYTHVKWERSELIAWLTRHAVDGEIYSNAADFIYLKTNVIAHPFPLRGADLSAWRESLPSGKNHYGAWFGQSFRTYLVSPAELSSVFQIQPLWVRDGEAFFEMRR